MASEYNEPRFVKCPKCSQILEEITDVPVYKCGFCGAILQARARATGGRPNPPCSTSERNSCWEKSSNVSEGEDAPSLREGTDEEAGTAYTSPHPSDQSAAMGVDTVSVASAPQSQLDGSGTLSKHGSVNSLDLMESVVISEEEVLDGIAEIPKIRDSDASISRSCSYEVSVSSGDDVSGKHARYRRLSRRTFRKRNAPELCSGKAKDGKESTPFQWNQKASPDEMPDASNLSISGLKQRSSSTNSASAPDDRSDSESSFLQQTEVERDYLSTLSSSPSMDSLSTEDFPCNNQRGIPSGRLQNRRVEDMMESPRIVDSVGDQPTIPYADGRRGEQKVPLGGIRHDGHRLPVLSNPKYELEPFALYNRDISQRPSSASGRAPIDQRTVPFPSENNRSPLHHHPEGRRFPVNYRPRSPQTYSHSSTATSSFSDLDNDVSQGRNGETSDQHLGKLAGGEKRQQRKCRRCRPVSGGAPFVLCSKCSELLQLPVDFIVSRGRLHKLSCGACSEVLTFLYQGGHIVPYRGQSCSSNGEPWTVKSSPETTGKRPYNQPPLHHLLGYASARDLMYVPNVEDEIYDNNSMSRHRRLPGDINDEGHGGIASSLAPQRRGVGYSRGPNQSEMAKELEEQPALRYSAARGRPPINGFLKGDAAELRRGLENMQLGSSREGRPR